MFVMNRFTGDYFHMDSEIPYDQKVNICFNDDIEFFEVDELIAPILQKLIKNKIVTHWSCSGHLNDSIPYIVIDGWDFNLAKYINKRILEEEKFHEDYVKYVREISFMTVQMDKNIFDNYQTREDVVATPREIFADIIGEDGSVECYAFRATGIYFKSYEQFCDENKIKNPTPYDQMRYYTNLWELVDATIDDILSK